MHPSPKQKSALIAAILASGLVHSTGVLAEGGKAAQLKRGALLVAAGDCVTCHTPFKLGTSGPEKDLSRGLSGHPEQLKLGAPPKLDSDWNWAGSATMTASAGLAGFKSVYSIFVSRLDVYTDQAIPTLSAAAGRLGSSVATVARRISALEAAMGREAKLGLPTPHRGGYPWGIPVGDTTPCRIPPLEAAYGPRG